MPPSSLLNATRAFPAAAGEAAWRQLVGERFVTAAAIGLILALAATDAARRGPWLDEIWTLELADTRAGLLALIRDGWLHDTHPPVFNAWATLLASLGIGSVPAGRLVSNLFAAGLMILAARRLSLRAPEHSGFNTVMLLLTLSLPQAMESFAVYRSYFWQITSVGTLVLVARHVVSTRVDLDPRRDVDLAAIAVLATAASIGLHYIGGLFGGLLAGMTAISAYRRGLRHWAALIFGTAMLATLFVAASVLLQAVNWAKELDHSWIDLPALQALGVPVALAWTALCQNPIAFAGFWIARERHDDSARRFGTVVLGALIGGVALILALHAFQPIVVDRYLFAIPVLVSALVALPAARLVQHRLLFGLLALVAVAGAATPLLGQGIKPLWNEAARTIATVVAECPSTQVYAASGWALGPAAETRAARREDPVFARAYRSLAEDHGFEVRFLGQDETADAVPGACPILLWFEHTPNEAEADLAAAVEAAGLTGLQKAHLSVTRSATGFVVRADRR